MCEVVMVWKGGKERGKCDGGHVVCGGRNV